MDAARRLGRYRLGAKIGSGGSADVYEARAEGAEGFEKALVVKRIRPDLVTEPKIAEALREEAMLARTLDHGNIVQVLDYGEDDGAPYLVLERVDGCSLRALLVDLRTRGEPLPVAAAVFIAEQVADALHYLHRAEAGGLVHRDVKPENILLSRSGVVKLTDFGIAKTRALSTETAPGFVKGTPRYLAPEQAAGRPLDGRVDIYALGTVLGELCEASERPRPQAVLTRATELDPKARYETAHAMRADLETWRVEHGQRFDPATLAELVERAAPSASTRRVVSLDAALGDAAMPNADTIDAADPTPAAPSSPAEPRGARKWIGAALVLAAAGATLALWPSGDASPVPAMPTQPSAQAEPQTKHTEPEPEPEPEPTHEPEPEPTPEPPVEPEPAAEPAPKPDPAPKRPVATGTLRINVLPYANVSIDGKDYGRTPVDATLRAGKHRVTLENPQTGKTARGSVVVSGSGPTSIRTWDALK